jgi:hypothetical protein
MATITDFEAWLANVLFDDDYNDVCCLYRSVDEGDSYGLFSTSKNGEKLFVKCDICDDTLMLASSKAKDFFLSILDKKYLKGMNVDAYESYHREMEKND